MDKSSQINCLLIDDMHPSITSLLEENNIKAEYKPDITSEDVLKVIHQYQGLILRSKMELGKQFFEAASALKFIARAGAGMEKIDLVEAKNRNIVLLNAPEGNANALAEHALSLLLNLMNKINISSRQVEKKQWLRSANRGYEIEGKTAAIIGYGYMGKAFAKKLHLLGCKVLAFDKFLSGYGDEYAQEATLEQIYKECDILSIHIPMSEENRKVINAEFFNRFQKKIWFINTARGEVLDTSALIKGLKSEKIIAAGLDVFENENLNTFTMEQSFHFEELISMPQVIMTPHIGGWTFESYEKINVVLVQKINKLLDQLEK